MRRWMLVAAVALMAAVPASGYGQTPDKMKDDKTKMEKMDKMEKKSDKMTDKKGDKMMKGKMMDKKGDKMMDKKDDKMEKMDKK